MIPVSVTNFNRSKAGTHSLSSILHREGYHITHMDESENIGIAFEKITLVASMHPSRIRLTPLNHTILNNLKKSWKENSKEEE